MPRTARIVMPGVPHHVTQRGNRRQQTFFVDQDYEAYIHLMAMSCASAGVQIWAYVLMPNHVHLIAVPEHATSLTAAIATAHEQYTRMVNFREGWRGHLWQGRYFSAPMNDRYTLACARYIELNPVRSGLVRNPITYRWSSARAHLLGTGDALVNVSALSPLVSDWRVFLEEAENFSFITSIRDQTRTGRPLGVFES